MTKYLLLKLSDKDNAIPFNDPKALLERANGNWHITPAKIGKIKNALLLYRGQILAEYEIGSMLHFDRLNTRTHFEMTRVKDSEKIGKLISTRTANPASTIDLKDSDL